MGYGPGTENPYNLGLGDANAEPSLLTDDTETPITVRATPAVSPLMLLGLALLAWRVLPKLLRGARR